MKPDQKYPVKIDCGLWPYGHCQGIAVDKEKRLIYCSFTTALIKLDFSGKVIGTVTGLLGHLGCIAFCQEDGRVYGSLEYKSDVIGRGILEHLGSDAKLQDAFYVAIFDADKIDRMDMDACKGGVMTAVYLKEVVKDYTAVVEEGGLRIAHRHGCSGIDGITFGKMPGEQMDKLSLFVAYGVYSDTTRSDNDHQVILRYDTAQWREFERPLVQQQMHTCGPDAPDDKLFVFTGNTRYGVQNLEYDPHTGCFFMAVYRGEKDCYPNYDLYVIDGEKAMENHALFLLDNGTGERTPGWYFPYGSTGLCSLGNGLFYISEDGKADGRYYTQAVLYRWDRHEAFVRA